MRLIETFTIGAGAGLTAPGTFIQDTVFANSRIEYIIYNNIPQTDGYVHVVNENRMYLPATTTAGDVIIIHAVKF
jgi:hypothetical protein